MRSGKLFGSRDGPRVLASNPAFNFEQLLQDAVEQEISGDRDDESSSSQGGEADSESDGDIKTPDDPAAAELTPAQPPTYQPPSSAPRIAAESARSHKATLAGIISDKKLATRRSAITNTACECTANTFRPASPS